MRKRAIYVCFGAALRCNHQFSNNRFHGRARRARRRENRCGLSGPRERASTVDAARSRVPRSARTFMMIPIVLITLQSMLYVVPAHKPHASTSA